MTGQLCVGGCGRTVNYGLACEECDATRAAEYEPDLGVAKLQPLKGLSNPATPLFQVVDLTSRIRQGYVPPAYRVDRLVADGTVTVIAAESGVGKSALLQALCQGVAAGVPVADMGCKQGVALYIDAEMGPEMFANRACLMGAEDGLPYRYAQAAGADLVKDGVAVALAAFIERQQANLVVLDSLRALSVSAKENDNDSMAPVLRGVLDAARVTGAAIVLIHHRGKGDFDFRGATAIRDQCDALFSMRKLDDGVLKLTCRGGGKFRYDVEPEPVYLQIDLQFGGVFAVEAPEGEGIDRAPVRSAMSEKALEVLREASEPMSGADVARQLGRTKSDGTVRDALAQLASRGDAHRETTGWVADFATPARNLATGVAELRSPKGSRNLATLRCGHTSAWRRSPAGDWICAICHPPAQPSTVEWREVAA